MSRWGALAGRSGDADSAADRSTGERDSEGPPALAEFLDDNHQFFTTIGVFGVAWLLDRAVSLSGT